MVEKRLTKAQREYREKLLDGRWQRKRLKVMERAGFRCEWCPTTSNLQVHHGCYSQLERREPWEYSDEILFCLCDKCHERSERERHFLYLAIGALHPKYHYELCQEVKRFTEQVLKQDAALAYRKKVA